MRHYSWFDQLIIKVEDIVNPHQSQEAQTAALMRVNHSGEVCAQALYQGQAAMAKDPQLKVAFEEAALEEQVHLEYCANRLTELQGRTSYLNPVWAAGAYGIGMLAGLCGDKFSLGFLAETEYQVVKHLETHLAQLPPDDVKSRNLLLTMREDELKHADTALAAGGMRLPWLIRICMAYTAKVMTFTAQYI